jgi:MFS family permease
VTLRESIRALPRSAWVLYGGSFINRFGSFVATFLILYLQSKGFSAAKAGLAVSAYGIGHLGASIVGGHLADRIGRRRTIALSMFASAAAMLALSQAEGLALIGLITAAAGFAAELYRPASMALLADLVPDPDERVVAYATYRLAVNAGFAFGPAVAGFLATKSYFLLFLGDAITSVIYGVIALTMLPEGRHAGAGSDERATDGGYREVLKDRIFLRFLLPTFVVGFVIVQSFTTLPLHVEAAGLSPAFFGLLISLNGLIIIFVELPLVSVTRTRSAPRMMATGMLLTATGFGLTAFAHTPASLAAVVVVWTFGEMIHAPMSAAYVANLAPPNLRGRYSGMYSLVWGSGFIFAPVIGGLLFTASPGLLWGTCAAIAVFGAAVTMTLPDRNVAPSVAQPEAGPELPGLES